MNPWKCTVFYMKTNLALGRKSQLYTLIQITEKIKESIEKGCFGCGMFIDLKKKQLTQLIIIFYF